jgi:hypothetical protein
VGQRDAITPDMVKKEIDVDGVNYAIEWTVPGRVMLDSKTRLSFAEWCNVEAEWLAMWAKHPEPLPSLGVPGFLPLRGRRWADVGEMFQDPDDESGFEMAKAWIGDAILNLVADEPFEDRPRPWARFFPNIEKRLGRPVSRKAMLCDWLADEVWSMAFAQHGSFEQGRIDLATRLAIIERLASRFRTLGTRSDLAIAEALIVMDVVTHSPHWLEVSRAMPRRAAARR